MAKQYEFNSFLHLAMQKILTSALESDQELILKSVALSFFYSFSNSNFFIS